jgi:hypothetical protein
VFSSFLWLFRASFIGASELLDCRLSKFIGGAGFGRIPVGNGALLLGDLASALNLGALICGVLGL